MWLHNMYMGLNGVPWVHVFYVWVYTCKFVCMYVCMYMHTINLPRLGCLGRAQLKFGGCGSSIFRAMPTCQKVCDTGLSMRGFSCSSLCVCSTFWLYIGIVIYHPKKELHPSPSAPELCDLVALP